MHHRQYPLDVFIPGRYLDQLTYLPKYTFYLGPRFLRHFVTAARTVATKRYARQKDVCLHFSPFLAYKFLLNLRC
jgi:hypothetical protein